MTFAQLKPLFSAIAAAALTYFILLGITPTATEIAENGGIVDPSVLLLFGLALLNGLGFGLWKVSKFEFGISSMAALLSAMTFLAGYMSVYLIGFGSPGAVVIHLIGILTGTIVGWIFSNVYISRMKD